MSPRTQRSIIPKLEENESPETKEEFESEIKSLLESEVETEKVEKQELVYQFQEETKEGAKYSLQNQEDLEIGELPGMGTFKKEFSVTTDKYGGIDKVGVGKEGNVTIENSAGKEENYFLAGAFDGQAIIKDENGIIWRFDTEENQIQYRAHD